MFLNFLQIKLCLNGQVDFFVHNLHLIPKIIILKKNNLNNIDKNLQLNDAKIEVPNLCNSNCENKITISQVGHFKS